MYSVISATYGVSLLLSWLRFKSLIHPHFIMVGLLAIMFSSDFLVRGYEDENIAFIPHEELVTYQWFILSISVLVVIASWVAAPRPALYRGISRKRGVFGLSGTSMVHSVAAGILLLEITKRLYASDWSVTDAFVYSFGPRFGRPWASGAAELGDSKFYLAILEIILPVPGLIWGVLAVTARRWERIFSIVGFLAVFALVVGNGSRTYALLLLGVPVMCLLLRQRGVFVRLGITAVAAVLAASIATLMYSNRNAGYLTDRLALSAPSYHQDDSYYRALRAMHIASSSTERLPAKPFIGASLLNFIPRALWSGKPTVDRDYWGTYKDWYVTISFVGELVAIFGIWAGSAVSVAVCVALFRLMSVFYKRVKDPFTSLVYAVSILYVYMAMRSLLNLSQGLYILLFFVILHHIQKLTYWRRPLSRRSSLIQNSTPSLHYERQAPVRVGPVDRE